MWAVKWQSENLLDGKTQYLMGGWGPQISGVPRCFAGYTTMVFRTRQAARDFIREYYGYIRRRADLRCEPHGWKTPIPVRVTVQVLERAWHAS